MRLQNEKNSHIKGRDPNKVLEVKVDLAPAIVIAAVKEAGFKAEQL